MAIEWPSIALGSGTGTTYTSPDNYTWVWSGDSWKGLMGNALGGFPAPWVIFINGNPIAYRTLSEAMNAAVADQTIHLYGNNVTEPPVGIILKDKVNINLNGHTYKIQATPTTNYGFVNTTGAISVKIYNGEIQYIDDNSSYLLFYNGVSQSSFVFENVKFSSVNSVCGQFNCSVTGGSFHSTNNGGFVHFPNDPAVNTIVKDVYGSSINNSGVSVVQSGATPVIATYTNVIANCTIGSENTAFYVYTVAGTIYLFNCKAMHDGSSSTGFLLEGGVNNGAQGKRIRADKCYGYSRSLAGISCKGTILTDCVAEGGPYSFENTGFSEFIGCSDSMTDHTGGYLYSLITTLAYDLTIDNCAFSYPITSPAATTASAKVSITNTTITPPYYGIIFKDSPNVKFNIENCVIGDGRSAINPIRLGGTSGSRIINCTLMSNNVNIKAIEIPSPTSYPASSFYLVANICIGCSGSDHPQLTSTISSNKGNLIT